MVDGIGARQVVDLAEFRAVRSGIALPMHVAAAVLYRQLEEQAAMIGAVTGRMAQELAGFSGDLGTAIEEAAEIQDFCAACRDALELEDIDAMARERDRLAARLADLRKETVRGRAD